MSSSKKAQKPKRLGRSINALVQISLAVILVFTGFLAVQTIAPRYDLTVKKEFSLSEYTEQLLVSQSIAERKNKIHLTCYAAKSSPHFARIKTVLDEYSRLSGGMIRIDFIDPLVEQQSAFNFLNKYEIQPTSDILVVDANHSETSNDIKHIRFIALEDLIQYEVTEKKQRRVSGYLIEDQITTALLSAIEGTQKIAYLVTNNTSADDIRKGSMGETLDMVFRSQNITLNALSLSEASEVPDDASALIFLKPQYDLEPEELETLTRYWNRPRASLLFFLNPEKRPKRIRAFLRSHGITQRDDRLVLTDTSQLATKVSSAFTAGPELNGTLQGKSTIFEGEASTLEVREAAEDLINRRIAPVALIQTSSDYYSEARHREPPFTLNPKEDFSSPLYFGAAVIRGNEMNDQTANNSSRLIALSSVDFLKSEQIREEQIDFLKNGINWLVGRPELIGIGPRTLQTYKLNLVPAEVKFINRLTLVFLPLTFLLLALMVWNFRRS